MPRSILSWVLLIGGAVLLAASLGQYGFMMVRQHQLRRQWDEMNTPAGRKAHPAARGLRLIIPRIHLDDAVVRGTDYEDLLVAPGLLEGSPLPGGRGGNTVIAGHRDTFFRHVADLRRGDRIEVRTGGRQYDYQVTARQIVKPTQISVLASTPQPRLTLVTCYPTYWIGPAPERLVVQAALEQSSPYR